MTIYAVNGKEPVAAWIPSLDTAGNGTTTLTDLVGSNNGTLTNMDAATDWVLSDGKYALDFDGLVSKDDEVRIATSSTAWSLPTLGNKVSISAWVKNRSFPTYSGINSQEIWQHGPNNTTNGEWYLTQVNNQWRFQIYTTGPHRATSTTTIASDTWYHVVGTWDGAQIKIYVNGILEATAAAAISPANLRAITRIGRLGVTNFEYSIDGLLDDIRIWNSSIGVLDATDVSYLYNSGNGRGRVALTTIRRQQRSQQIIS